MCADSSLQWSLQMVTSLKNRVRLAYLIRSHLLNIQNIFGIQSTSSFDVTTSYEVP